MDKLRQDYQDGINTLKMFMDATNEKMTAPVQVSFLNVRAFAQDVEVNLRLEYSFHLSSIQWEIIKLCIPTSCRKSSTKCPLWKQPVRQQAGQLSCWPKTLHRKKFHRWLLWWLQSKSSWVRCVFLIIRYVAQLFSRLSSFKDFYSVKPTAAIYWSKIKCVVS